MLINGVSVVARNGKAQKASTEWDTTLKGGNHNTVICVDKSLLKQIELSDGSPLEASRAGDGNKKYDISNNAPITKILFLFTRCLPCVVCVVCDACYG